MNVVSSNSTYELSSVVIDSSYKRTVIQCDEPRRLESVKPPCVLDQDEGVNPVSTPLVLKTVSPCSILRKKGKEFKKECIVTGLTALLIATMTFPSGFSVNLFHFLMSLYFIFGEQIVLSGLETCCSPKIGARLKRPFRLVNFLFELMLILTMPLEFGFKGMFSYSLGLMCRSERVDQSMQRILGRGVKKDSADILFRTVSNLFVFKLWDNFVYFLNLPIGSRVPFNFVFPKRRYPTVSYPFFSVKNNNTPFISMAPKPLNLLTLIPVKEMPLIAVIDNGIDLNIFSNSDALFLNPYEIPDNGVDDDQNGFIDDVSGWDFTHIIFSLDGSVVHPRGDHGSAVANIIAGRYEFEGKVQYEGVNPDVKILNLSIRDNFDLQFALRYAVDMGVRIINLSITFDSDHRGMRDSILYALSKDVLIVAAIGNESMDIPMNASLFPVSYSDEGLLGVAFSCGEKRTLSEESNYGDAVDFVSEGCLFPVLLEDNVVFYLTGSSIAAPIISSIAARIWGHDPSLTRKEVIQKMIDFSEELDDSDVKKSGYGKINVPALVQSYFLG